MPIVLSTRDTSFHAVSCGKPLAAYERLSWDLRYAFRGDAAQVIVEGPFFRLTPILQDGEAAACWEGQGMLPTYDRGSAYSGWRNAGAPAIGAFTLSAARPFYDIDANSGVSVACSAPCSVDVWAESIGTWVFDTYRYQGAPERMSARAIQTRMIPAGQTIAYEVPRGAHRFAIRGAVANLTLMFEKAGKGTSSVIVVTALNTVSQWGQYQPTMNAATIQVEATSDCFLMFEIELP